MKRSTLCTYLGIFLTALALGSVQAKVITYTFPAEFPTSDVYDVRINQQPVQAYQTKKGSFLSFGMTGPVELSVTYPSAPKEVIIRPLSAGVTATITGKTCKFKLPRPMNLSMETDGDLSHPLFIFANPKLTNIPSKSDPNVTFFEAGKIYDVGEIILQDNETLYLEGGAVVRGVIRARNARNVAIRGAGIIDASTRKHKINMLVFRECDRVLLENIFILDPFGWTIHLSGSKNIKLTNTRVLGWRQNCDGIDIEYSKNVHADGCFWQTTDDCVAVKAIYPPGVTGIPFEEMINPETLGKHKVPRIPGDVVGNILITNSVLSNAHGQTFEIGFELRVDQVSGVTFRNCDIIHGGVGFSIHNGDRATISNMLLDDIRVEQVNRLIDFTLGISIYSDDCPPPYRRSNPKRQAVPKERRPAQANNVYQWYVPAEQDLGKFEANRGLIRNITVRNMKVLTPPRHNSIFSGYNTKHNISGVRIEGLKIQGDPIRAIKDLGVYLHHVNDIQVTAEPAPQPTQDNGPHPPRR
ncbi:MAG: hypothetical protein HKP15_03965 [Akkermansiaceae bacterium]|nr:hypothetical protein [Akkermansiaceae bacterium]